MQTDLVVTRPFGDRQIGDRITDSKEQAAALAENGSSVVRTAHIPDAPDPDAKSGRGSSQS